MISISRMKELAEEEAAKEKLKAYMVEDKNCEAGMVIFAESSGKAKSEALYKDGFEDYEYTELRAKRMKQFDKYSDTKKIPIREMLELGWWFGCEGCCGKELTIDDLNNGDAIIIDNPDRWDWVEDSIICTECANKKN